MAAVKDSGILIPRVPKKSEELKTLEESRDIQKETHRTTTELLEKNNELQQESLDNEEEQKEKQEPIWKALMGTILHPSQKKFLSIRNKLTEKYNQVFIKGGFFKKIGDSLASLVEKTGDFLWKFLKALLVLAIFDPKGEFLTKTIIPILTKVLTFVTKMITKFLPPLIKAMINIVFNVLPKALEQLFSGIGKAFFDMFDTWMKEFPKDSIMYKVLEFIRGIFAEDSILMSFLKSFSKIVPYLLLGVALFKAYTAAMALLNLVINANPFTVVITTLLISFTALWAWRDKIAKWFEDLFDWFSKLGVGFKIIIGILAVAFASITAPIVAVAATIYGIVKLFQSFAKIGVANTFKLIWSNIKDFFSFIADIPIRLGKAIWDFLKEIPFMIWEGIKFIEKIFLDLPNLLAKGVQFLIKKVWSYLSSLIPILHKNINKLGKFIYNMFKKIVKLIKILPKLLWNFIKNLPRTILDLFKKGLSVLSNIGNFLWSKLKQGFSFLFTELPQKLMQKLLNIFDPIRNFFNNIINWFSTIGRVDLFKYFRMDEQERERAQQVTKIVREATEAQEMGIRLPKQLAQYAAAEKSDEKFNKLLDEFKNMSNKQVEVQLKQVEAVTRRVEETTVSGRGRESAKYIQGMSTASARAR